jgi:hypothetical protein
METKKHRIDSLVSFGHVSELLAKDDIPYRK